MSCIGTAGHVDHGKSTLVKALTGIDPDRLAEEKERGMTIDLGFAWLTLPSGREVSIVDVPGHESFIKNMLAGVGSIDVALLVIAADEGMMPQTREHLAILDLLRVQRGVVVLTKADLVDEEWLALVREEVAEQLKQTTLAGAHILPVSAYTGQGLKDLLLALEQVLAESEERQNIGRPRLGIDRVFSMTGFGTVVTGTLLDGILRVGQEVELLPRGLKARIRSMQMHKQAVEQGQPGNRVALNLSNVSRTELKRGDVVGLPGQLQTTLLLDASIHLLSDAPRPLLHNAEVDFYCGSQEISARIRLLDRDEVLPGESAWAQLRLNSQVVVTRRDRFILRIPSPGMTIGGGEVLDVQPRYHRRHQSTLLATLQQLQQGSPQDLVMTVLRRRCSGIHATGTKATASLAGYELAEVVKLCNLAIDVTQQALETLLSERRVCRVGVFWFAQHVWDALVEEAIRLVSDYHQQYPLRSGLSKEEWRTRLNLPPKMAVEVFMALQTEGKLDVVADGSGGSTIGIARPGNALVAGLIRLPNFTPDFTPLQKEQVEQLLQRFRNHPYTPPGRVEAEALVGSEIVAALLEQGQLVKVTPEILFLRATYEEALIRLTNYLRDHGKITVAEARDILGGTRKYILPLLEQMDSLRITRRIGDERVLVVVRAE